MPAAGLKLEMVGLPFPISTVTFAPDETAVAPSLSVALAVMTCDPLVVGVQANS